MKAREQHHGGESRERQWRKAQGSTELVGHENATPVGDTAFGHRSQKSQHAQQRDITARQYKRGSSHVRRIARNIGVQPAYTQPEQQCAGRYQQAEMLYR